MTDHAPWVLLGFVLGLIAGFPLGFGAEHLRFRGVKRTRDRRRTSKPGQGHEPKEGLQRLAQRERQERLERQDREERRTSRPELTPPPVRGGGSRGLRFAPPPPPARGTDGRAGEPPPVIPEQVVPAADPAPAAPPFILPEPIVARAELDPRVVAVTWQAGLEDRARSVEVLFSELLAAHGISGSVEALLSEARRTVAIRVVAEGRGWIVPDFDAQLLQLDQWFDAVPGSSRSAWVSTLHRPAIEEQGSLTRGLVG